ncbi:MAG TPA: hypothetical protein DD979_09315 [Gammaproteobacteria bacterium]|jgi:hypothetical protein|nr:hypothetical protein [Gammaproteobacteria bacterium]
MNKSASDISSAAHASTVNALRGVRFARVYLLAFVLSASIIVVWKRADIFPWIGGCNPQGYDDTSFMAYCHSSRYGDYEHRAFWHGLEAGLIEPVREADVLFLGNSRTQYAFSTDAIARYFEQSPLTHYVFGFGMGSQNFVAEKMADKFDLRPSAVVINADPFFTDRISVTNQNMLEDSRTKTWEYGLKRWMQNQQRSRCAGAEDTLMNALLCGGQEETLFRNTQNGHWDVRYFRKNRRIPVAIDANSGDLDVSVEEASRIAEAFLDKLQIDRNCMILTVTPRTATPLAFAEALAERLGVPGIFPMPEHLVTVDDSHLDPDSAMRWSNDFIHAAGEILESCAADS